MIVRGTASSLRVALRPAVAHQGCTTHALEVRKCRTWSLEPLVRNHLTVHCHIRRKIAGYNRLQSNPGLLIIALFRGHDFSSYASQGCTCFCISEEGPSKTGRSTDRDSTMMHSESYYTNVKLGCCVLSEILVYTMLYANESHLSDAPTVIANPLSYHPTLHAHAITNFSVIATSPFVTSLKKTGSGL
jgi:hypothetical protein